MLLQNPQLAYALLQAQIVMKIVEPQVALVSHFLFNFSSISPSQPTNTDTSLLRLIIKWGLQFSQSSKSIQTVLRRPCLSFYAMSRCCGLGGGGANILFLSDINSKSYPSQFAKRNLSYKCLLYIMWLTATYRKLLIVQSQKLNNVKLVQYIHG